MAHEHIVNDSDKHFAIDPISRTITNESGKVVLIQYDHNSERFTFEMPKEVEHHDMSLCNVVQVHFLNIEASTKTDNEGLYEVDDFKANEDKVTFSWLISNNATQYIGTLHFAIRFACVANDGTVEYDWHTDIYTGIVVAKTIFNSEVIVSEYADVLEKWRASLFFNTDGVTEDIAMGGHKITGMGTPANDTDAATKKYVDDAVKNINFSDVDASDKVSKAGDIMAGQLDMNTNKIIGLGTPEDATDAANKAYVDKQINDIDVSAQLNQLSAEIAIEMATKLSWVKIWENASPSSQFGEQDIVIPAMADYDVIAIVTGNGVYFISTDSTGFQGMFFPFEYDGSSGRVCRIHFRKITMDSNTQIDINDCYYAYMGSNSTTTDNSFLVPLYICGAHKKEGV